MDEIKIGDIVVFFVDGHHPAKTGQVVDIIADECDVFVTKETIVYRVKTEKCKKIS